MHPAAFEPRKIAGRLTHRWRRRKYSAACFIFTVALSLVSHGILNEVNAKTPWEAQVGGFVYVTIDVFVRGEFSGQAPANQVHRNPQRACTADDFSNLKRATVTRERFLEFDRQCATVEMKYEQGTVTGIAYLPIGYCENIRHEYLKMLKEQVYSYAIDAPEIVISYKGADLRTSRRDLARGLDIATNCNSDGSFSVTAQRKRR